MTIDILETKPIKINGESYRVAEIAITNGVDTYKWFVGGLPANGDLQIILDGREAELWQAAEAGGQLITEQDIAIPDGKAWLKAHRAAIDFMRLSPDEQQTAIDAMSTVQLKTTVWYMTVIISALVKERFL